MVETHNHNHTFSLETEPKYDDHYPNRSDMKMKQLGLEPIKQNYKNHNTAFLNQISGFQNPKYITPIENNIGNSLIHFAT